MGTASQEGREAAGPRLPHSFVLGLMAHEEGAEITGRSRRMLGWPMSHPGMLWGSVAGSVPHSGVLLALPTSVTASSRLGE